MSDGGKKIFDQCAFVFLRTRLRASSARPASQPVVELSRGHLAIFSEVRSPEPDDDECEERGTTIATWRCSPAVRTGPTSLYCLYTTCLVPVPPRRAPSDGLGSAGLGCAPAAAER